MAEKGGQYICSGSKHNETPTDKKNLSVREPPGGLSYPPFSNKAHRPNAHLFYVVMHYNGNIMVIMVLYNFTLLF